MPRRATSSPARSLRDLGRLRLLSQGLVERQRPTPADAVRALLALQGQDFGGVKWSIGLRAQGATDADVEAALAAGTIVRSWPLRGTLHVTAAEDLPWLLDAFAPRVLASFEPRRASLGLDPRTLERAREVAVARLSGGKALTRAEMLAAFAAAGIETGGQRGYHTLFYLSLTQTLCFGPPADGEQTFVLLGEWVKRPRRLERDEALGELARRYFEGHGPATLVDLAGWAKLTAADARKALALARPALAELDLDGERYYLAPGAEDALAEARPRVEASVLALPGFDEYLLGYKGRGAVLAPEHAERIVPGGNGVFQPTIVVDGIVKGTWRKGRAASGISITSEPFEPLSKAASSGFSRSAEAYVRFVGGEPRPA